MGKWAFAAVALASLFLSGGCSEEGGEQQPASSAPAAAATQSAQTPTASPSPTVTVTADKTHAVQPNDEITLTIEVSDFALDASKIGQGNEPGVGHYRVYLDAATGDDFLAQSADATTKITVPDDITDGSHELRVVLRNNDRSPLEPPVEGRVLLIVYRL